MTTIQQGSLLDVLKKKMRQTKEEMERYKEECEDFHKKLQMEVMRREEVRLRFFDLHKIYTYLLKICFTINTRNPEKPAREFEMGGLTFFFLLLYTLVIG